MFTNVAFLPDLIPPAQFRGAIAVMIDVFRASTSIIHGSANGASGFAPCLNISDARSEAAARPGSLLAGERGGVAIDGFDLDNSPAKYNRATLDGRFVVMTTTNGTRALLHAAEADEVLVGAFVNRAAVVRELVQRRKDVILVCAGTDGCVTSEDVLFAGSVVQDLSRQHPDLTLDDPARIAMDFFAANSQNPGTLLAAAKAGLGGSNLMRLGFDADIELAMTPDLFSVVPRFDATTGKIQATG